MSTRLIHWLFLALGLALGLGWLWVVVWQVEFDSPFSIDSLVTSPIAVGLLPILRRPPIW